MRGPPSTTFRCSPRSATNVTMKFSNSCRVACAGLALCLSGAAQSAPTPSADSASFDADGTAHVTRVVPMPSTISPERTRLAGFTGQEEIAAADSG